MSPASLIPVADTLTAPNGWFQFFLMLTFPLHLFAMNAMLGAGLVAFISHLYPGRHTMSFPINWPRRCRFSLLLPSIWGWPRCCLSTLFTVICCTQAPY